MLYRLILANLEKIGSGLTWRRYTWRVLNQTKPHCLSENVTAAQQGRRGLRYACMLNISTFLSSPLPLPPFKCFITVMLKQDFEKLTLFQSFAIPYSHLRDHQALCERWLVFLPKLLLQERLHQCPQQTLRFASAHRCVERRFASSKGLPRIFRCGTLILVKFPQSTGLPLFSIL